MSSDREDLGPESIVYDEELVCDEAPAAERPPHVDALITWSAFLTSSS